jgi:hypothetical protein
MKDEELFRRILQDLVEAKILRAGLRDTHLCFSAKLRYVYPMYKIGWKKAYAQILDRLSTLDNLYIIGRSALFLHCNMEHCLLMGIKLAEFLGKTERRKEDWIAISSSFHDFKVKE